MAEHFDQEDQQDHMPSTGERHKVAALLRPIHNQSDAAAGGICTTDTHWCRLHGATGHGDDIEVSPFVRDAILQLLHCTFKNLLPFFQIKKKILRSARSVDGTKSQSGPCCVGIGAKTSPVLRHSLASHAGAKPSISHPLDYGLLLGTQGNSEYSVN